METGQTKLKLIRKVRPKKLKNRDNSGPAVPFKNCLDFKSLLTQRMKNNKDSKSSLFHPARWNQLRLAVLKGAVVNDRKSREGGSSWPALIFFKF